MKTTLLTTVLILLNLSGSGQGKKGEFIIDDSKIKEWNQAKAKGEYIIDDSKIKIWDQAKASDYQSVYHFSVSEVESTLVLILDEDSCYAQIQSGEWIENDGKEDWIQKFETVKNVKIKGNKFFSDKTNGEFVIFDYDNQPLKGLMVYKPWSSWVFYANSKGFELGNTCGQVNFHFPGKFPYASWRRLSKEELDKMSKSDLQIMRNEIYARYGYIFKLHGDMDLYFKKQSWYHGQKKNIDDYLTGLEQRNIELIQITEKNKSGL